MLIDHDLETERGRHDLEDAQVDALVRNLVCGGGEQPHALEPAEPDRVGSERVELLALGWSRHRLGDGRVLLVVRILEVLVGHPRALEAESPWTIHVRLGETLDADEERVFGVLQVNRCVVEETEVTLRTEAKQLAQLGTCLLEVALEGANLRLRDGKHRDVFAQFHEPHEVFRENAAKHHLHPGQVAQRSIGGENLALREVVRVVCGAKDDLSLI
mmetsp:Transcript_4736/g.11987  ORF Transcript_4736/g.11987 Transcript_4736/m.11987 type:complete len:216 (+) Transcript_4736:992-1639(+)